MQSLKSANRARTSLRYSFVLSETPKFLMDELAVKKAREAMAIEGLSNDEWIPHEGRRSSAPDGKIDSFLLRNGINANAGVIQFTNKKTGDSRLVSIELEENRVICRVTNPK